MIGLFFHSYLCMYLSNSGFFIPRNSPTAGGVLMNKVSFDASRPSDGYRLGFIYKEIAVMEYEREIVLRSRFFLFYKHFRIVKVLMPNIVPPMSIILQTMENTFLLFFDTTNVFVCRLYNVKHK